MSTLRFGKRQASATSDVPAASDTSEAPAAPSSSVPAADTTTAVEEPETSSEPVGECLGLLVFLFVRLVLWVYGVRFVSVAGFGFGRSGLRLIGGLVLVMCGLGLGSRISGLGLSFGLLGLGSWSGLLAWVYIGRVCVGSSFCHPFVFSPLILAPRGISRPSTQSSMINQDENITRGSTGSHASPPPRASTATSPKSLPN